MHIDSLATAIVAAAFWIFVTVSAYAAIKYDFRRRQLAMESLRAAIERGQPLEPAVVEKILGSHFGSGGDEAQDREPYLHPNSSPQHSNSLSMSAADRSPMVDMRNNLCERFPWPA